MSARIDPADLQPARSALLPAGTRPGVLGLAGIPRLAGKLAAWFAVVASLFTGAALAIGLSGLMGGDGLDPLWVVPLLHLAAAWAALGVYLMMAACAALALGAAGRIPGIAMGALAPAGAAFAVLALWTGMLSGRAAFEIAPSGAQLTAEGILLVMYAGYALLRAAIRDAAQAERACAALVLVGVFNLPIIYFSVQWWHTLQSAPPLAAAASSAMAPGVLAAVSLLALALCGYAIAAALARVRCRVLQEPAGDSGPSSQEQA
jgi:heme exporter protein C